MRPIVWAWALLAVSACSGQGDDDPAAMTKDEARRNGGKADDGRDWCEVLGWYGDGICDDFCPQPDVDDCGGCGGIAGLQCPDGQYCHYSADQRCGAADQMGACVDRPEVCAQVFQLVCGCDGETYGNACDAASAGVSVAYEGE